MKKYLFLLVLLFLVACTPDNAVVEGTRLEATAVLPTPSITATTMSTITAVPPTPSTIHSEEAADPQPATPTPTPTFCTEPPISELSRLPTPTNLLRVLFLDDDLWLWREETGTAVSLTNGGGVTDYQLTSDNRAIAFIQAGDLWMVQEGKSPLRLTDQGNVTDFRFSDDGILVAYSRALENEQYELWVMPNLGGTARLLASPDTADTWARHPDAEKVDLDFYWAEDSHLLAYYFTPTFLGIGDTPPQPVVWLDGDNGERLISPPAAALPASYSGYQLNLVTAEDGTAEWQLVHVADNRTDLVLLTHPHATWTAAPNGRFLIASTTDGAVVIDLTDLSQQAIPLTMQTIGVSHYRTVASSWWLDDTNWLAVIPETGDVFQPGATFSLWRVDVATGTAVQLGNYPGFALEVILSPDQSRIAFWQDTSNGKRNLHLVDVAKGEDIVYDHGRYSLLFHHWLNDNSQFIYSYGNGDNSQSCFLLGQLDQPPQQLTTTRNANVHWVDPTRAILITDYGYRDNSNIGTLTFQALNGAPVPIGNFLLPLTSDSSPYITYFEEP